MSKKIDWDNIKLEFLSGSDLKKVSNRYGISLAEILLKSKQDKWGDRGITSSVNSCFDDVYSDDETLTDVQVTKAHKADLGKMRLVGSVIVENIRYVDDIGVQLKMLEKASKIFARIIPLERITYGIDVDDDGLPDKIIIRRGNTSVEV